MSASYPTKLLLAFRSGDHCALPQCSRALTVDSPSGTNPVIIGVAAHIAGENPSAARYNATMTDEQRDDYTNLIYLCGDHHTQIDKQAADFPVNKLLQLKIDHELKVRNAMNSALADVGFPELEQATQWIVKIDPAQFSYDLTLIPPEDKILKNELSNASKGTITMGLSVVREVRAFVENEAKIDSAFPDRLRAGFLQEYFRLRREKYKGDDLFDMMCQFAQQGMIQQAKRSAGLAVLIYLFEACEVFEK
jgi:hypothetical protein